MPRALRFYLWPAFAVLVFLLANPAAHGQIRDGGIDPWNLGKGDWVYAMTDATNRLGGHISSVTNENSLMLFYKSQGIRYMIVKSATSDRLFNGCDGFPQFTTNLVKIAHTNGILIFGYNRSYGSNVVGEVAIADYLFAQGADGFVFDAEAEWESGHSWITNAPAQAWQLCSTIRAHWPNKFLAHAPLPIIALHNSFPYKEFGYWCDAVMPQIYHFSTSGLKRSPSACINWSDVNWQTWQSKLGGSNSLMNGVRIYWTNSIKPLTPLQDVYGPIIPGGVICESANNPYPDKDVMEFIDYAAADRHAATDGGYRGVNFWSTDLHSAVQWASIRSGTSGNFPGIVNNIVIDDPDAYVVGAWTAVKVFGATVSTPTYFGATGTDTNSFGTNYLTHPPGSGASYVEFDPQIDMPGDYDVYEWHPYRADASTNVPFVITYSGGTTTVYANQQTSSGNWNWLGRFNFAAGFDSSVLVTDGIAEPGKVVIADGLKLVFASGPAPASGLTASAASTSRVDLDWTDNSENEEDFVVSRGTNSGGPYSDIATLPPDTTHYANTNLPQDTTYFYVVRAENFQGATNSNEATATTLPVNPQAPVIVGQPQSQALLAGQSATLSVSVSGSNPLRYQWRFNGAIIAGATDSALAFASMAATNVGAYSVVVTNRYGTAQSPVGLLGITTVMAFGNNDFNQTEPPNNATNTVAIAAGAWHSLALRADGGVAAWGDNFDQQCAVPTGLTDAVAIAAGGYHSLAVKADGKLVAWGANDYGQASVPSSLANVIGIAAGTWHSLALKSDGTVAAWGDNSFGQTSIPAGLANVVAVRASGNHSLALKGDGTVAAWGENTDPAGTFVGQSIAPAGLAAIATVAAGGYHSLAVKSNGTVTCWGDNSQSQCEAPAQLGTVVVMAGGGAHSVALKSDGSVAAWGANWDGQCDISPSSTNMAGIAAGESHTLLLLEGTKPPLRLLNPARNGAGFKAVVQTMIRKNYVLEFKNSLGATSWTSLGSVAGNGALIQLTDAPASGPQRFYRVRQW